MYILLTAFEPFGGAATNITQEVMQHLPEQIGEHHLTKRLLPVSFRRAPVVLRDSIEQTQPDFVLMLGQCKDSDTIRLERYAHNIMNSRMGDNDGYCPNNVNILEQLDDHSAITSGSLGTIFTECQAAGLPVSISTSAGQYVCNRVYYEALQLGHSALFVHIPKTFDIEKATQIITFLVQNL